MHDSEDWLVQYLQNLITDAQTGYAQTDDAPDCAIHIRKYMAEEGARK